MPPLKPSLVWTRGEVTSARGVAVATPAGSGYFPSALNPGGVTFSHYQLRNPKAVIVIEAGGDERYATGLDASFLDVEALVLLGSKHEVWFCASPVVFRATIPVSAAEEYRHPGAREIWTMPNPPPAAGGPPFDSIGAGNCCYPVTGANLHGFLYVGGRLSGSGCVTSSVVGSVVVAEDVGASGWRDINIYADDDVIRRVRLTEGGAPWRASWKDFPAGKTGEP